MKDKMFRYLEKYVKIYRVIARYDLDTENFPKDETGGIDESFDDLYIPCKRGEIRGSYLDPKKEILAWYSDSCSTGRNVYKQLKQEYPEMEIAVDDCGSFDYYIYFEAKDIEKIASLVVPRTSGKNIKPFSAKNLPKPLYEVPEEDVKKLAEIFSRRKEELKPIQKAAILRKCLKQFDPVIEDKCSTKKKKFEVDLERKKSGLPSKEFIHSLGLWEDFVAFLAREIEEGW